MSSSGRAVGERPELELAGGLCSPCLSYAKRASGQKGFQLRGRPALLPPELMGRQCAREGLLPRG